MGRRPLKNVQEETEIEKGDTIELYCQNFNDTFVSLQTQNVSLLGHFIIV